MKKNNKLYYFGIIGMLFFMCISLTDESEILWRSDYNISWNDFQGNPDSLSSNKAKTYSKIEFIYIEQDGDLLLDFACYFNKSQSWSNVNFQTKESLSHEQLHFDIAELVARKIRKECTILQTEKNNLDETLSLIDNIYNRNYDNVWDSITNQYDSETNHGLKIDKQLKWKNKIALELNSLKDFARPNVVKKIKK